MTQDKHHRPTSAENHLDLSEHLKSVLTKAELIQFCENFPFSFNKSWNKTLLAGFVEYHMLARPSVLLNKAPLGVVLELQRMVHAVREPYRSTSEALSYLENKGLIAFDCAEEETPEVCYLPRNLWAALEPVIDTMAGDPQLKQWNDREVLLCGIMHCYGILSGDDLVRKYREYSGESLPKEEFYRWRYLRDRLKQEIRVASEWKRQYHFASSRVWFPKETYEAIQQRKDLDYFPFSVEDIRQAGTYGVSPETTEMKILHQFLLGKGIPKLKALNLVWQALLMTMNDVPPAQMMQSLVDACAWEGLDEVNKLARLTMELHNHLHQWTLKGYSPHILFEKERKFLKPLPDKPFTFGQPPHTSNGAIGRNDPCPCGSGKKYKKCCGS